MGIDPAASQRAFDLAARMANLRKRILLLGLDLGWAPAESTSRSPGDSMNIADYDVVIANVDMPGVAGMLAKNDVARLVASGGSLFLVGAPLGIPLDFLPGGTIIVREEPVETVTPSSDADGRYEPVVSLIRRADYSVQRPLPSPDDHAFQQAIVAVDTHTIVMGGWVTLAAGRQGDPVAFGVFPGFWRATPDTPALGEIVWLGRPRAWWTVYSIACSPVPEGRSGRRGWSIARCPTVPPLSRPHRRRARRSTTPWNSSNWRMCAPKKLRGGSRCCTPTAQSSRESLLPLLRNWKARRLHRRTQGYKTSTWSLQTGSST
jgi:hypothetical protein